ncbi:hypothetical protein EKD02_09005 [Chlorobium phaeovibrioides]|uniref:Uncharacterized protein n=1 Tax=Chlorobium phaeovibrioides TaxID=1094 RepID=A0A3S0MPK3_CHLPH|nr:hypothetical protein [Chlorobium phaeovibrioides]RTY35932.1 hypothetical protein EKD02_09005 [Chlorobium phaeovibrioides]
MPLPSAVKNSARRKPIGHKMFGISDITKVCYYPAAGTDIQAILRFSHLTDTILAPTTSRYLTRQRQEDLFKAKCNTLNSFFGKPLLELVDVVDLDSYFEDEAKYLTGAEDIFSKEEQAVYMRAFMPLVPKRLSATKFVFKRTLGRTERKVNWIHTSTEGIATLAVIFKRTGALPEIFCTIQTGNLEYPYSILLRIIKKIGTYPEIWVRGFWPTKAWSRIPIQSFPPYKHIAQDYGNWNSSLGITTLNHEDNSSDHTPKHSCVRAFTREPLELPSKHRTLQSSLNPNRRLTIEYGNIIDQAGRFDGSIISERMNHTGMHAATHMATTWETLSGRNPEGMFPALTFLESLEAAGTYAMKEGLRNLAVTPMGYEDEGISIQEYLDASDKPVDITVFLMRPLDYISLCAESKAVTS